MFGEIPMFGNCTKKFDKKGRIILPSFCKAEKDDKIIVQRSTNNDYFILVNFSKIEEELKTCIANSDDDKLAILTSTVIALVKVDTQMRINLKSKDEKFVIADEIFLHGNYDNIQIFNSEKDYQNYIDKLKKSR